MKRLLDDPRTPPGLREDLLCSRLAGRRYDTGAGLPGVRTALADSQREPLGADVADVELALGVRAVPGAWKLAAIIALGGGVGVFAWSAQPSNRPATEETVREPGRPATRSEPIGSKTGRAATGQAATGQAATGPVAPATASEPAPAPDPVRPGDGRPLQASRPHVPKAAPPTPSVQHAARREIAQLVRIRGLLASDPAAAHRLALRSAREFPDGLLVEERRALIVIALARSGRRAEAARRARAFLARYPDSPMREQVEAALRP
ncbi:MAG: hypothetical protein OXU20_11230 [Myxococcales bacterium]|nr:hypothetical protein [Myxococcales bacterium]MDD9966330.1 hypothetical protein [Myxococcales bacterium]